MPLSNSCRPHQRPARLHQQCIQLEHHPCMLCMPQGWYAHDYGNVRLQSLQNAVRKNTVETWDYEIHPKRSARTLKITKKTKRAMSIILVVFKMLLRDMLCKLQNQYKDARSIPLEASLANITLSCMTREKYLRYKPEISSPHNLYWLFVHILAH